MGKLGAGLRFLKKLYGRLEAHNISGLSAQLSYFFFLSLFPLLMAVFSLLPFLPVSEEDILYFLEDFAPEETMTVLESAVERILADHNGKILSISILITLWSASNGMNAIIRAMNLAYEVKENRPFFITRGISVLLTAAMIFVILVALALPVFGKQLGIYLFSKFGLTGDFLSAWHSFRWGVSSIVLFIVFTFLYYYAEQKDFLLQRHPRGARVDGGVDGFIAGLFLLRGPFRPLFLYIREPGRHHRPAPLAVHHRLYIDHRRGSKRDDQRKGSGRRPLLRAGNAPSLLIRGEHSRRAYPLSGEEGPFSCARHGCNL